MKRRCLHSCVVALSLLSTGFLCLAQDSPALMPMPAVVKLQQGHLPFTHRLNIEWRHYRDPLLERAVDRFVNHLMLRTGIDMVRDHTIDEPSVTIAIDCAAADPNYLTNKAEESYRLQVTNSGVLIEAPGPAGVLHALATLLQLVTTGGDGYSLQQANIEDMPRFLWRGLQIDIARHFMPLDLVEHEVDAFVPEMVCGSIGQCVAAVESGVFAAVLPAQIKPSSSGKNYVVVEDDSLDSLKREIALAWHPRTADLTGPIGSKLRQSLVTALQQQSARY